jgi:ferredoxin
VGLISGYHALQAGIEVVGLAEAMPSCGGYNVHLDKLRRLGIPVYTSHTVLRAEGSGRLESVTIGQVDRAFRPLPGTEKSFAVDTLLIAVGLSPVNEIYLKAREYGMKVYAAGDAEEIAEASAAIFSGRIQGRRIARELGKPCIIPNDWGSLLAVLRGKPGPVGQRQPRPIPGRVYPVIRCIQQIPCDPCLQACPKAAIAMEGLSEPPSFASEACLGCAECVLACPGLAIVLVDEGFDPEHRLALLTLPLELEEGRFRIGEEVETVGTEGERIGAGRLIAFRNSESQDRRRLLLLEVPFEDRLQVAGIRLQQAEQGGRGAAPSEREETIVCRCERVTQGKIVGLIRAGYRDMNQIKSALRAGMGACGGKSCTELILRLFREEGVDLKEVKLPVHRPPESEVPLEVYAGGERKGASR